MLVTMVSSSIDLPANMPLCDGPVLVHSGMFSRLRLFYNFILFMLLLNLCFYLYVTHDSCWIVCVNKRILLLWLVYYIYEFYWLLKVNLTYESRDVQFQSYGNWRFIWKNKMQAKFSRLIISMQPCKYAKTGPVLGQCCQLVA